MKELFVQRSIFGDQSVARKNDMDPAIHDNDYHFY